MTDDVGAETMRRVSRRIVSFPFVVFVFNQLDRVNVSFAALQMNAQLGFTAEIYGLGVGLFFVSYLLFEIPSNMVPQRVGARFWLGRGTGDFAAGLYVLAAFMAASSLLIFLTRNQAAARSATAMAEGRP